MTLCFWTLCPDFFCAHHADTSSVVGVNSETAKRLIPDEQIPEPKQSVEGEKEREEKAAKPASEKNEASVKGDEL